MKTSLPIEPHNAWILGIVVGDEPAAPPPPGPSSEEAAVRQDAKAESERPRQNRLERTSH